MTSNHVRPLVLVVEDDRDTRDMYSLVLDLAGFDVITSSSAEAAFDLAVSRQPGVVVTDLLLDGAATGVDLCRNLRKDPRTARIPALLLTGSTEQGRAELALQAGCAEVRLKPHLPDALVSDIRNMLRRDEQT